MPIEMLLCLIVAAVCDVLAVACYFAPRRNDGVQGDE